jgi:hypothetical protein
MLKFALHGMVIIVTFFSIILEDHFLVFIFPAELGPVARKGAGSSHIEIEGEG